MSKNGYIFLLLIFCLGNVDSCRAVGEPSALEQWTGRHSRLVWVQDQGDGSDTFAHGNTLLLYGYDSRDGRGERALVSHVGNYFKPFFTPDGKFVVYSDRKARQMFLLEWDTGKVVSLGSGVAVAAWEETGALSFVEKPRTWIYCFLGGQPENKYGTSQPLFRFPLDSPKKKELVWGKTGMAWSNVQISRDGKLLGGLFPWPHAGIVSLDTGRLNGLGRGCWTSLSPDNSKLFWVFDDLHRNIAVYDTVNNTNWKVRLNDAPGIRGYEVYHPRWSNHPRYFVITGPYEKGEEDNKLSAGGERVEVYVGRFDSMAKKVVSWLQVTQNRRADFYPDLWIEGGEKAQLADAYQ